MAPAQKVRQCRTFWKGNVKEPGIDQLASADPPAVPCREIASQTVNEACSILRPCAAVLFKFHNILACAPFRPHIFDVDSAICVVSPLLPFRSNLVYQFFIRHTRLKACRCFTYFKFTIARLHRMFLLARLLYHNLRRAATYRVRPHITGIRINPRIRPRAARRHRGGKKHDDSLFHFMDLSVLCFDVLAFCPNARLLYHILRLVEVPCHRKSFVPQICKFALP